MHSDFGVAFTGGLVLVDQGCVGSRPASYMALMDDVSFPNTGTSAGADPRGNLSIPQSADRGRVAIEGGAAPYQ